MRRDQLHLALVFLVSCLALSYGVWDVGIASGWIDPVRHLGAQDDATYTSQAISIATGGEWLTPKLSGRFYLEKPPLLVWLSAVSIKLFGISPLAARLPCLLAGALVGTLCFAVARSARSFQAGIAAALLCLSNQVLFTLSRHNMTDILLTAFGVCALTAQAFDPPLARRSSRIMFSLAIAGGVFTKSIAGMLPAMAAILFAAIAAPHWAQKFRQVQRTAFYAGLGMLLASPWFIYQLMVHRDWLLADMGFQILKVGLEPLQTSPENHVAFYLLRVAYCSPLAAALSIAGIPAAVSALRRRNPVILLVSCYLAVMSAALLLFRFHSQQYMTPWMPVLILFAALCSPLLERRFVTWALTAILIAFVVKAANHDAPWGLSYRRGNTVSVAGILSEYCEERRSNDLYLVDVEDEFYAVALPLAQVKYGWYDPTGAIPEARPHLLYLGIVQDVTAPGDPQVYADRLRAWGMNSTEPLATILRAVKAEELVTVILEHPESDFLVSAAIARALAWRGPHERRQYSSGRVFLRSRTALPPHAPGWTCRM